MHHDVRERSSLHFLPDAKQSPRAANLHKCLFTECMQRNYAQQWAHERNNCFCRQADSPTAMMRNRTDQIAVRMRGQSFIRNHSLENVGKRSSNDGCPRRTDMHIHLLAQPRRREVWAVRPLHSQPKSLADPIDSRPCNHDLVNPDRPEATPVSRCYSERRSRFEKRAEENAIRRSARRRGASSHRLFAFSPFSRLYLLCGRQLSWGESGTSRVDLISINYRPHSKLCKDRLCCVSDSARLSV